MEVTIEAKRFVFSSLVSSVLFRVEEIGTKWRQVVDLKLHEGVWIIRSIRLVCDDGFRPGKWMNRYFSGRAFSVNCKSNRAGCFVEIAICGAKRRLRTLIIPAGDECHGLKVFADALAATTAGPERRPAAPQGQVRFPLPNHSFGASEGPSNHLSGSYRSFAEVVRTPRMAEGRPEARPMGEMGSVARQGLQKSNWIPIWGLNHREWDLEMLRRLKDAIPGSKCVVPVISEHTDLVAMYGGPLCEVPRAVTFDDNGVAVRVLLDTVVPVRLNTDQEREGMMFRERGRNKSGGIQNESLICERRQQHHVMGSGRREEVTLCGEELGHLRVRVPRLTKLGQTHITSCHQPTYIWPVT